jgi:hypothetical protein
MVIPSRFRELRRRRRVPDQVLTAAPARSTPPDRAGVLVRAADGVGLAAVQLARAAGSRLGNIPSDAKLGLAKEAGADAVINTREGFGFADEVLRLTGNQGVVSFSTRSANPPSRRGSAVSPVRAPRPLRSRRWRAGSSTSPRSRRSRRRSALLAADVDARLPTGRASASGASPCCATGLQAWQDVPAGAGRGGHRYLESRQSTGKLILVP